MTDFLNESAVAYLNRPKQRPFVLFLAHKAVHFPYLPARRHEALYESARYTPPAVPAGDLEGIGGPGQHPVGRVDA